MIERPRIERPRIERPRIERPTTRQPQIVAQRFTPTPGFWHRLTELSADRDLQLILAFSLIGLLTALNLMFRFPEFGAVIAQYNQF
jgi:hypothetical protein